MKQLALVLFFVTCIVYTSAQTQDLIITKKGFKIQCKIVKDDSVSLFYNIANHHSTLEIKKNEVAEYYYNLRQKPTRKSTRVNQPKNSDKLPEDLFLFALNPGLAIPAGDFADKNVNSETAGLAKVGFQFEGTIIFKLAKNIGVCASYHHQQNPIAKELINQQIMAINFGAPFTTTATDWKIRGLFGGLYLETHIERLRGLSVYVNAMVGRPRCKSPEIISKINLPGYNFSVTQNAANARGGTAFILGPGVMYKITDEVGANFGVNYMAGQADFSNVMISNSNNMRGSFEFSQKFTSINVQFGLVLSINKK